MFKIRLLNSSKNYASLIIRTHENYIYICRKREEGEERRREERRREERETENRGENDAHTSKGREKMQKYDASSQENE